MLASGWQQSIEPWRGMTAMSHNRVFLSSMLSGRYGSGPAAEEIRKLPFGEISWPMSGNGIIAEVVS